MIDKNKKQGSMIDKNKSCKLGNSSDGNSYPTPISAIRNTVGAEADTLCNSAGAIFAPWKVRIF